MITPTLLWLQKTDNTENFSLPGDCGSSVPTTLLLGGLFFHMKSVNKPRRAFKKFETLIEAWWARVKKLENGCWEWQGARYTRGYGKFQVYTKKLHGRYGAASAHVWGYEQLVGPVPEGLELDHLCRNTSCVNPAHLEPVTHLENLRRGQLMLNGEHNRSKTHCPEGHPFTPENTYVFTNSRTGYTSRSCRTCIRANKNFRNVLRRHRIATNK